MNPVVVTRIPGLSGERARQWRQFACWAAAADLCALPAAADTVLTYLTEHPGTPATQRGRLSALNAAHELADQPSPGAAEAVRRALNPGRAQRLHRVRVHADALIAQQLPITGWPHALTGRRDAVILQLATGGLSWRQISTLTQADITLTEQAVRIGTQPLLELPATGTPACPVRVFSHWAAVLTHAPAATGHIALERLLTATGPSADLAEVEAESFVPQPFPAEYAEQPLLCGFDERGMAHGYIGELDPLPADVVADIATAHLLAPPPPGQGPDMDPDYHERGIAARRRAKELGDELDDLLDDLDDRIDAIAARIATNNTAGWDRDGDC